MSLVSQGAFSAIELVIVILIVGVLAAVVAVSFTTQTNMQLDGVSDKLAADVRYCQQLAMCKNGTYSIVFEPASDRYTLYYFNGTSDVDINDPLTHTSPMRVDYTATGSYSGINLVSASFNGGQELRFTARGIPQDATGAVLSSAGSVVVSNSAGSQTVSVAPDTGNVTKS